MVGIESGKLVTVPIEYVQMTTKTVDARKLEIAAMMAI
jgi:hypothetical protein